VGVRSANFLDLSKTGGTSQQRPFGRVECEGLVVKNRESKTSAKKLKNTSYGLLDSGCMTLAKENRTGKTGKGANINEGLGGYRGSKQHKVGKIYMEKTQRGAEKFNLFGQKTLS